AFFGVLWSGGSLFFNQAILLLVKILLARLLLPEDFGLASMAFIVLSSLNLINAFGTGSAYIRDRKSDEFKAKNTLFYLDAIALFLIFLISFLAAPYVADFFSVKLSSSESSVMLKHMIQVLSLMKLLDILAIIPTRLMTKNLMFKQSTIASLFGTLAYGITTVTLAFLGFGAWSIILGQIANHLFLNLTKLLYCPFFPRLVFSKEIAGKYLKFGRNQFVNSVVNVVITNGGDTLIGRILGATVLGFYSLAMHFAGLLVSLIAGIINRVMFPILSKLQDDKEGFRRAFLKSFRLSAMFVIPAIIGAVVLADEIVFLVFGEKWASIVPIFYILSISSFLNSLIGPVSAVFNSLNKPELLRKNGLIKLFVFSVLIFPFIKWRGVLGVALIMVVMSLVSYFYLSRHVSKIIDGYYRYTFGQLSKILFSSFVMALVVYYIKSSFPVNIFWLFVNTSIGVIIYFIPMSFLDKDLRWDLEEIKIAFKHALKLK
ncbi:lipopolysaccharide biosynthesis protein, partial [Candidatus Woesearchaeota archaeon]|nr:lipopolysaccharide biosynthesis protein [Candidatus Woesearchaeota archaeon]